MTKRIGWVQGNSFATYISTICFQSKLFLFTIHHIDNHKSDINLNDYCMSSPNLDFEKSLTDNLKSTLSHSSFKYIVAF
jgi:hypothetical protein